MGIGYNFRCESCGHTDRFFIGVGFSAQQVHQETLEKIRAGEYGEHWQELLRRNPQADVDTSYCMLYCADCHLLERGIDLTIHFSDAAEGEDETVPYPHLCPQCQKRWKFSATCRRMAGTTVRNAREKCAEEAFSCGTNIV